MKLYAFIAPSQFRKEKYESMSRFDTREYGWGCGYVAVPKEHPWFGVDYRNYDSDINLNSEDYEEITFSRLMPVLSWPDIEFLGDIPEDKDYWVIGFDCDHSWNTIENTPKEVVIKMTEALIINAYSQILTEK
jgi:hypothetical protein